MSKSLTDQITELKKRIEKLEKKEISNSTNEPKKTVKQGNRYGLSQLRRQGGRKP